MLQTHQMDGGIPRSPPRSPPLSPVSPHNGISKDHIITPRSISKAFQSFVENTISLLQNSVSTLEVSGGTSSNAKDTSQILPLDAADMMHSMLISHLPHLQTILTHHSAITHYDIAPVVGHWLCTRMPMHYLETLSVKMLQEVDISLANILSSFGFPCHLQVSKDSPSSAQNSNFANIRTSTDLHSIRVSLFNVLFSYLKPSNKSTSPFAPMVYIPALPAYTAALPSLANDLGLDLSLFRTLPIVPYPSLDAEKAAQVNETNSHDTGAVNGKTNGSATNETTINPLLVYHLDLIAFEESIKFDVAAGRRPSLLITFLGTHRSTNQIYYYEDVNSVATICHQNNIWIHVEGESLFTGERGLEEQRKKRKLDKERERKLLEAESTSNSNVRQNAAHSPAQPLLSSLLHFADSIAFSPSIWFDHPSTFWTLAVRDPSAMSSFSFASSLVKLPRKFLEFSPSSNCNFGQLFSLWYYLHTIAVPHTSFLTQFTSKVNSAITTFKSLLFDQHHPVHLISPVAELGTEARDESSNPAAPTPSSVKPHSSFSIPTKFSPPIPSHPSVFFQMTLSQPWKLSDCNLTLNQVNVWVANRLYQRLNSASENRIGAIWGTELSYGRHFDLDGFVYSPKVNLVEDDSDLKSRLAILRNLFTAMQEELHAIELCLKRRKEFEDTLRGIPEFEFIPKEDLQGNPRVGLGAFRFVPNEIPAEHLNEVGSALNQSLVHLKKTLQPPFPITAMPSLLLSHSYVSYYRPALTIRQQVCTIIDVTPILAHRTTRSIIDEIIDNAHRLSLPNRVMQDVSDAIVQGIRDAERKRSEVTGDAYRPTNLVRWLPIVGSVVNYWVPPSSVEESGQSFDLRKRELSAASTSRYTYGSQAPSPTDAARSLSIQTTNRSSITSNGDQTPTLTTSSSTASLTGLSIPTPSSETRVLSQPLHSRENSMNLDSLLTPTASFVIAPSSDPKKTIKIFSEHTETTLQSSLRSLSDASKFLAHGVMFTSYFPPPDQDHASNSQSRTNPAALADANGKSLVSAKLLVFYQGTYEGNDHDLGNGPIIAWCESDQRYVVPDQAIALQQVSEIRYTRSRVSSTKPSLTYEISIRTPQIVLDLQSSKNTESDEFFFSLYSILVHIGQSQGFSLISRTFDTSSEKNVNVNATPPPHPRSRASSGSNNQSVPSEGHRTNKKPNISPTLIPQSSPITPKAIAAARAYLEAGAPFVVYVLDKNDSETTSKHAVTLWYKSDVANGKGSLCWCRRGNALDYSPSRSLPLNKTVQICMGKQTKAFRNSAARDADLAKCFSVMVDRMILNLEAASSEKRSDWLNAFHSVMTAAGKQRVFDDDGRMSPNPSSATNNTPSRMQTEKK